MGSTSTLSWNLLFRSCAKRAQFKFINSNNSASASVSVWPGCTRGYRCNSSPTSKSASAFPFRTSLSLLDSSTSRIGFKSSNSSLSSRLLSTSSRRLNSTSTSSSSNSTASTTKDAQLRFAKAQSDAYKLRNRSLFMYTVAVFIAVIGATYAAVPLYRAFCAATGFSGTPIVGETGIGRFAPSRLQASPTTSSPSTNGITTNKRIRVTFNADASDSLPWSFKPSQKEVKVLPGETALAFFEAENRGDRDVTGIATYNVAPDRAAPYFAKVECFCFESQRLLAHEQVDLPVFFFIDSDILDDPACRDVQDVVLSYTFFAARRNERSGQLEPDTDLSQYQVGMDLPGVK